MSRDGSAAAAERKGRDTPITRQATDSAVANIRRVIIDLDSARDPGKRDGFDKESF